MAIRKLKSGDEQALEAFLQEKANTTMHIRSNVRRIGFVWDADSPKRQQGIYYGAVAGDGSITGVIGYFWNGNILMQPEGRLPDLLAALRQENLIIKGILGPAKDVRQAIALLGLKDWPVQVSQDEQVYVLDLAALQVPAPLADGAITVRALTEADRDLAIDWRIAFNAEALGAADTPDLRREVTEEIESKIADRTLSLAEKDGVPVAMSGRDAVLPDSVTVGPVWTPPEHRGNGYARAVVAGSLLHAKAQGGTRSILFTDNPAAVKAYTAVGFRHVDEYGLTLLAKPFPL